MTILTDRARAIAANVRWRSRFAAAVAKALIKKPLLRRVQIVAITGSAGKTTTKDLCAGILSNIGPITKTQLSSNSPTMVAKTVASIRVDDRYAVLEVSGGEPKRMDWPLRLFTPDIAVITLIQREHARPDFGLEEIAAEKFRLVDALPEGGTAVLNFDDPILRARGQQCGKKVIWVGRGEGATLRLLASESRWPQPLSLEVSYLGERLIINTRLHGEHLALSVLCSVAVGIAAGLTFSGAVNNLQSLEPSEGRMQVVTADDGVVFLRDDWKAPLWSFNAPLAFMRDAIALRKVIVIGTLSDYSRSASKLYPQVAQKALEVADQVIFVGPHAHRATKRSKEYDQERLIGFSELSAAASYLRKHARAGDLILLKGTNRVDHLVRLILDRGDPIACWETKCGILQFCTHCPKLYDFARSYSANPTQDTVESIVPLVTCEAGSIALVGLGNPGPQYQFTRHNAGHLALDFLAEDLDFSWQQTQAGMVAQGLVEGLQVTLVKPNASINNSGKAIDRLIGSEALGRAAVVIHDDMDLELGRIKIRRGGGDGGHLGLRSIITVCKTQEFQRVRLGVRPLDDDRKTTALVHDRFSDQELRNLRSASSTGLLQMLKQKRPGANEIGI